MKPIIASTGSRPTIDAGLTRLSAGGSAMDAVVAAALAWPSTLSAAGCLVAVGAGFGRIACRFSARVPGFGLSRPQRSRMIEGGAVAARVATSSAAQALTAVQVRWGTGSITEAALAASAAFGEGDPAPHEEALALLSSEGVSAFTRGAFSVEAARKLGPLAGGLLTRRDMIETRPELGEAQGPEGVLWTAWPLAKARRALLRRPSEGSASPQVRRLAVIAVDGRGAMASLALEAGGPAGSTLPRVAGVVPNQLFVDVTAAQAKKVGQPLSLGCIAAAGGEDELVGVAGEIAAALAFLDDGVEPAEEGGPLLLLRRTPGGRHEVRGARFFERP